METPASAVELSKFSEEAADMYDCVFVAEQPYKSMMWVLYSDVGVI